MVDRPGFAPGLRRCGRRVLLLNDQPMEPLAGCAPALPRYQGGVLLTTPERRATVMCDVWLRRRELHPRPPDYEPVALLLRHAARVVTLEGIEPSLPG